MTPSTTEDSLSWFRLGKLANIAMTSAMTSPHHPSFMVGIADTFYTFFIFFAFLLFIFFQRDYVTMPYRYVSLNRHEFLGLETMSAKNSLKYSLPSGSKSTSL